MGPEPHLPFSKNHSNTEISNFFFKQHLHNYSHNNLSPRGKTPLLLYLTKHKYSLPKLNTLHIKWLTWVLSGHSPLFYFQHKIGKAHSPWCSYCESEPETSEHFLGQCYAYATIRLRTFGHVTMTWSELLSHKPAVLIKYIATTDRFNLDRIFVDRTTPI